MESPAESAGPLQGAPGRNVTAPAENRLDGSAAPDGAKRKPSPQGLENQKGDGATQSGPFILQGRARKVKEFDYDNH